MKKLYDRFFSIRRDEEFKIFGYRGTLAIESTFRQMIRQVIDSRLLPKPIDTFNFVCWALAGPPDESESFDEDLLLDYCDISKILASMMDRPDINRAATIPLITDYFNHNKDVYKKFSELALDRSRTSHLVHFYLFQHREYSSLLLIIDNVDRIETQYQSAFLTACRDIRMSIVQRCAIAIGIRFEDIRERGIPGDDQIFDILAPDSQNYSGLLLPQITSDHMKKVLDKRGAYVKEFIKRSDSQKGSEYASEYEKAVESYHRRVVGEFIDNQVNALANNSYTTVLRVYVDFMRYIWTLSDKSYINIDDADNFGSHLQTLFYLWLQENGPKIGIPLHNIIEYEYDENTNDVNKIASVQHLLLTCILNRTNELRSIYWSVPFPEWSEIVRRMMNLGFVYENIRLALQSFLTPIGEPPGAVRMVSQELTREEIEEVRSSDTFRIELTSRGYEVVTNILDKVGYVWGVAHRSKEIRALKESNYFSFTRVERAQHVYLFAKGLAKKHLKFLSCIDGKYKDDAWVARYRSEFGVNNRLQVERILDSASKFYGDLFRKERDGEQVQVEIPDAFNVMLEQYRELVGEVGRGSKFEELNFDKRMSKGDALF
jgi:hypothetical protein